ncbi:MAG: CsbD family protein [Rubrobacter sp.]|nr:CsbD family protein [Rubrobacter sp.]
MDKAKGRMKEAAGSLTGDKDKKSEGRSDQTKGKAKDKKGKAKDLFK